MLLNGSSKKCAGTLSGLLGTKFNLQHLWKKKKKRRKDWHKLSPRARIKPKMVFWAAKEPARWISFESLLVRIVLGFAWRRMLNIQEALRGFLFIPVILPERSRSWRPCEIQRGFVISRQCHIHTCGNCHLLALGPYWVLIFFWVCPNTSTPVWWTLQFDGQIQNEYFFFYHLLFFSPPKKLCGKRWWRFLSASERYCQTPQWW